MTYSPGSSGYQPAQPPGSYGAPAPSYAQAEPGPSKLPGYLNIAVVVLGLAAYVASFGPVFTSSAELGTFSIEASSSGGIFLTLASLLASLLAAIALLPKAKNHAGVVAILAVLGVLVVVSQLFNTSNMVSLSWAAWLVLGFTILQAIAAVAALLLEAGVIKPPAPRPKYEQPQYGQYSPYGAPGGYYGGAPAQPQGPPSHAAPQHNPPPGPRPGYAPPQYGGYQPGPSTGGFGAPGPQGGNQHGAPTPPTGFPSFSPPPAVGAGQQQAPSTGPEQPKPQSQSQSPAQSSGPNPS